MKEAFGLIKNALYNGQEWQIILWAGSALVGAMAWKSHVQTWMCLASLVVNVYLFFRNKSK